MTNRSTDRRAILQTLGATGALATLQAAAFAAPPPQAVAQEVLPSGPSFAKRYPSVRLVKDPDACLTVNGCAWVPGR